ncbi:MAG: hypothetical protein K2X69_10645 [Silvanigrellaceae bacterium]|nr:hypothetical protein [Silvanigrellaceae bacterium]
MATLATKNENEALEVLMINLDDSKTITDEFLAEFAGVNKSDFNRRADQLEGSGIVSIFSKLSTAESKSVREPTPKIIRKYSLVDVILILSQYKNQHQIRALKLCKIALNKFVYEAPKSNKLCTPKNGTISVPIYTEDLFGDLIQMGTTVKPIIDLSYEEFLEAKIIHIKKTISGLIKKEGKFSGELLQLKSSKLHRVSKAIKSINNFINLK